MCGNKLKMISLGYQPLANNLLKKTMKNVNFTFWSKLCNQCHNCQLSVAIDQKNVLNYLYTSSTSQLFKTIL